MTINNRKLPIGFAGSNFRPWEYKASGFRMLANEYGRATSTTSTTLVDTSKSWAANAWQNKYVVVCSSSGPQTVKILSNTSNTLTVASWPVALPTNATMSDGAQLLYEIQSGAKITATATTSTGQTVTLSPIAPETSLNLEPNKTYIVVGQGIPVYQTGSSATPPTVVNESSIMSITGSAVDNTFTENRRLLKNNVPVFLSSLSGGSNLNTTTIYYTKNVNNIYDTSVQPKKYLRTTFQLSTTPSGSTQTLGSNVTSGNMKYAMIHPASTVSLINYTPTTSNPTSITLPVAPLTPLNGITFYFFENELSIECQLMLMANSGVESFRSSIFWEDVEKNAPINNVRNYKFAPANDGIDYDIFYGLAASLGLQIMPRIGND